MNDMARIDELKAKREAIDAEIVAELARLDDLAKQASGRLKEFKDRWGIVPPDAMPKPRKTRKDAGTKRGTRENRYVITNQTFDDKPAEEISLVKEDAGVPPDDILDEHGIPIRF